MSKKFKKSVKLQLSSQLNLLKHCLYGNLSLPVPKIYIAWEITV